MLCVFNSKVLGEASQAHLLHLCLQSSYLSKEAGTFENLTLHPTLIMPSPTGPNLFILLLYVFKTKGYLLFCQDYIPLSVPRKDVKAAIHQPQEQKGEEEKLLFKHSKRPAPHWSPTFWCFIWRGENPPQTSQELDLYLQKGACTPGTQNDSPKVTEPGKPTQHSCQFSTPVLFPAA